MYYIDQLSPSSLKLRVEANDSQLLSAILKLNLHKITFLLHETGQEYEMVSLEFQPFDVATCIVLLPKLWTPTLYQHHPTLVKRVLCNSLQQRA